MRCDHLGRWLRTTVKVICRANRFLSFAVYECAEHGECLPTFTPTEKQWEIWQADSQRERYKVCARCDDCTLDTALVPS